MKWFVRSASLPLGVDIGTEFVSIVASEASGDGFTVCETQTLEVPACDPTILDRKIAETILATVATFESKERRCILAVPAGDVITRTFRVPPGMRRSEADRAAALEADSIVDWAQSERLVALDPIPGDPDEMALSIARTSAVERIVAIARAGGLQPVAVDVPACAWRRAIPDADALLDCTRDRAELVIFGTPIGTSYVFPPRLIDERIASQIRSSFVDARREGLADVQRLAILGSKFRYESLEALLGDDGYAVVPVHLGGIEAPAWAFAFGLASWSVAPRGLSRVMMRANLLPRRKDNVAIFGLEVESDLVRQGLLGIAIVVAIALIGAGIETLRLHRLENAAIEQEAAFSSRSAERDAAKQLALEVARYQEIAREEDSVRETGALASVSIARIGNSVPSGVWLDTLGHDAAGFELTGAARSVDGVSRAMLGLGSALPGQPATLANIDNHNGSGDGVRFGAHIANAATGASIR